VNTIVLDYFSYNNNNNHNNKNKNNNNNKRAQRALERSPESEDF